MLDSHSIDDLAMVGVSHVNAPVAIREKLSIPQDDAGAFLAQLRDRNIVREAIVLSTCNRTELYAVSSNPMLVIEQAIARGSRNLHGLESLFYLKRGRQMIKHAFTVASGIDSMILGEPEILGQMKKAFLNARQDHFAGSMLGRVFEHTFRVAKQVRTETHISKESLSLPAICAKLSREIFGDLASCKVLCIGVGLVVESALAHFSKQNIASLTIANRTLRNAASLAGRYDTNTLAFEDITHSLADFDIIITATSSVLPVIGKGALESACRRRRRRPIAIFDLAVPRDVESEADALEDLFLYTIDDIGNLAGANLDKRRTAVAKAEGIITEATEQLVSWFERSDSIATIKELRGRMDDLRETELKRALRAVQSGNSPEDALRELAHRLSNRMAHDPLQTLSDNYTNNELIEEISNWYSDDKQDKRGD